MYDTCKTSACERKSVAWINLFVPRLRHERRQAIRVHNHLLVFLTSLEWTQHPKHTMTTTPVLFATATLPPLVFPAPAAPFHTMSRAEILNHCDRLLEVLDQAYNRLEQLVDVVLEQLFQWMCQEKQRIIELANITRRTVSHIASETIDGNDLNNEVNRQLQQRIFELQTLTLNRLNQIRFEAMDYLAFVKYKIKNEVKKFLELPVMSDEEIRQQVEMDRQIRNGA